MSEVGAPKLGLMSIGEEARPPFAVLPDPASLFLNRSKRFDILAPAHGLEPYLRFLGELTRAQSEAARDLPRISAPASDHVALALRHGMPPISCTTFEADETALLTIDRLLDRLDTAQVPPQTTAAMQAVRAASLEERRDMLSTALENSVPADNIAQRVLVAAGLQVHFARLASTLDAQDLKPIADGTCPVCGSQPVSSSVVGWPKAHNTRFCACSLCGTMWNVVRIKCVLCSSTGGISFRSIEGAPDTVKAETCESCRAYVKILYQVNDPALEAVADDVATLGLDMLMAREGWRRGGKNAFLLGY